MSFSRGTTASNVFLHTGGDASIYMFYSAQIIQCYQIQEYQYRQLLFPQVNSYGWLLNHPRRKNEMVASQFSSVNPFTTFGCHNSNSASSFWNHITELHYERSAYYKPKIECVLCKSCSHGQTRCRRQKLGVETTSDFALSQTQNLGHPCVPDGTVTAKSTPTQYAQSST